MSEHNRTVSRGHEYECVGPGKYEILLFDVHCSPRVVIATTRNEAMAERICRLLNEDNKK